MKKEKTLSVLLYIFGPVIRYIFVSELALAAMDLVWDSFLQEYALQGAGAACSHSVLTVWQLLRLLLPAAAGCLAVGRDARLEWSAFGPARQEREMAFRAEAVKDPAEGSVTRFFRALIYGADDERVKARIPGLLLPATVFLALGINILFSCIVRDPGALQTALVLPGLAGFLLQILFYCFFMPFVEETVFRGILFARLQRWYGSGTALLASALVFGIYHGTFAQGIYAFVMGLVFACAYESSGNFLLPVSLHGACNLIILWLQWTGSYSAVCTPAWAAVFLGLAAAGFATICAMIKK